MEGANVNPLFIDKETKLKLRELSKELYGYYNRYVKLLRNGVNSTVSRNAKGKAILGKNTRYTPETLLVYLQEQKVKLDELKKAMMS